MNKKERENDWLKPLFSRLPEEELPASFREDLMKRIWQETAKTKKRNELMGLFSVILASLGIIALAVGALWYTGDIPRITWRMPELVTLSFYSYIGVLVLLLLGLDHLFRQAYKKRHPTKE
ncbi:MAG: hypothetical protein LBB84_12110 [Tannerellaceae bacterium]|jgi:hypothetical protein|nr:hypothetical protein [Tannerellaceae bacterium]